MALVTATCIKESFDNGLVVGGKRLRETRQYFKGEVVQNFDTELAVLANLTTDSGFWVFQYPGHEGRDPNHRGLGRAGAPKAPVVQPEVSTGILVSAQPEVSQPVKAKRTMTPEQKAALGKRLQEGRAKKKAARLAETAA